MFAKSMSKKVLLTSVCRPMGQKSGEGPSVGYELLHSQVTRAQGIFSPRTVNEHFSLDYIAGKSRCTDGSLTVSVEARVNS